LKEHAWKAIRASRIEQHQDNATPIAFTALVVNAEASRDWALAFSAAKGK